MFLVIGGLLVISGMVLNSLIADADDQGVSLGDVRFDNITCRTLIIKDEDPRSGM